QQNRNAEYVFNVTSAYVKARDFYAENRKSPTFDKDFSELKNALVSNLESVFNRGFSSGFFMGKPVGDWTSKGNAAKSKKCILGHVLNFYSRLGVAEISIDDNSVSLGEEIQIEGETTGFVRMKIESMQLGGNPIDFAGKGMKVSVKVPVKLRRGDRIFKFL
ncbi:MAG: U32 family peptidase, partial [Bacilli bacterium]